METLKIDKNKARKLYKTAAPEFKEMLIDTFGKEFLSGNIMDRIKSFEDACGELGFPLDVVTSYSRILTKDEMAYFKLKLIIKALNEGWEPNWNDSNEIKWVPVFKFGSGFGFSHSHYDTWDTTTGVGSRLCFKSEELCKYADTQFQSIYNDYLI